MKQEIVIGFDILPTITKLYNNRIHSSTNITPIQASLKKNEGYVYKNLLDKRKNNKPKYKIGDLVTTADLKTTFSKEDRTNWSNKLYKTTEFIVVTIPSYRNDSLPERYNEALLKKTELTLKEYYSVTKKNKIGSIQNASVHHCLCLPIYSLTPKHNHFHHWG